MARLRTAEECVADIRKRAGLENSQLLDDPEILEIFNQELAELKMHIRRNEGQAHDRAMYPFPGGIVAGTSLYTLPADFWEILGIEATIGGLVRRLNPYMENERADLQNSTLLATTDGPMYRLASRTQIEFLPAKYTFPATLKYVPTSPRLQLGNSPSDTIDGFNGYEMAAIYGAVAVCKEKQLIDPSFYEGRKARIYGLIEASAAQRDAGAPERVTDVTGDLDRPFGI
jgi:hypothetical protein